MELFRQRSKWAACSRNGRRCLEQESLHLVICRAAHFDYLCSGWRAPADRCMRSGRSVNTFAPVKDLFAESPRSKRSRPSLARRYKSTAPPITARHDGVQLFSNANANANAHRTHHHQPGTTSTTRLDHGESPERIKVILPGS
jgi:hypothetical protein